MVLVGKRSMFVIAHLCFASAALSQTFQDAKFSSGWTLTVLSQSPNTATASATVVAIGGAGPSFPPSPYRRVEHLNYNLIVVAHEHLPSIYDPSTGPITSIDYSYDLMGIGLPGGGQAVAYRLLLVQNGSYYAGPTDSVSTNTWTTIPLKPLTTTSFTRVVGTGPNQPDFSCKGGKITFGYVTANSTGAGQTQTGIRRSGLDNWKVTVNQGAPCCVAKIVCRCPPGSIGNTTNQPGITPDGKCKREVCRPNTGLPLPPDGTPIGAWGFTWKDTIWQYVEANCVVEMSPPGCCP